MGLNLASARPRSPVLWLGVLAIMALFSLPAAASGSGVSAATANDAQGKALAERLRSGGLILFFRHADTTGMHCDRSYRIGDRDGQRNLSPEGREQARRIGEALHAFGIPIAYPVRAGPVYRARDTAELAFGAERVEVTDSLLADDYAGPRLGWVLAEHRRLFAEPVPPGTNGRTGLPGRSRPGFWNLARPRHTFYASLPWRPFRVAASMAADAHSPGKRIGA